MGEKMHEDELKIDEALVHRLLVDQFPHWAELPLRQIEPGGTVNAVFRLGGTALPFGITATLMYAIGSSAITASAA